MLFNTKDLLVKEAPRSVLESAYENQSLFEFGLECMRESNEELRKMLSSVMIESGYMVSESFKDEFNKKFNFQSFISTIFNFFVNMIKKLFNQVRALLLKILYDNKTIDKYESLIRKYNKSLELNFEFYNYTYLDKDIPSSDLILNFIAEYEDLQDKLEKIGEKGNKEKITLELNKLYNEIKEEIEHGYFDKVRGKVLATRGELVFADNYHLELRRFFRDGLQSPIAAYNSITPNKIQDTLDRFLDQKNIIKNLEKHEKDVMVSCDKAKKKINKIDMKYIFKAYQPIDHDLEFNLNRILKLKCGQLSECCNIYTMAYSVKLEAVKEALIQDKKILFTVITDIIKNGGQV